jgi:diguanylate cyclase (GGDEF)-like protein
MLRYQSLHDSLTGLPNRDFFYQKLSLFIQKTEQNNQQIAILFIDLDRFKNINDTLNHNIGDQLLQSFTNRLITTLDKNIFISRWGGDEFTLITPNFQSREEIEAIAKQIKNSFQEPFLIENHTLYVSASIGISIYPQNAQNEDILIKKADAALYKAKELGRNNYQFYITQVNSDASFNFKLENSLYKALENNQLFLCYQPQINVKTGKIHGLEALLRWEHPELGLISPAKFIPLAEETGLILSIGKWVLETVCHQNKTWQNEGLPPLKIAVNLSALQFQENNFIDIILKILEKTTLAPQFLELEITEGLLMQDVESANQIIRSLLAKGVTFSLDDFGTGYSSLGYLKKFPFHTIKIDKSFIKDLQDNKRDFALISAIITIARGFDMIVIAEGVETEQQLKVLRSLDCEIVQGWLFSKPLNTEQIPDFISNNNFCQRLNNGSS